MSKFKCSDQHPRITSTGDPQWGEDNPPGWCHRNEVILEVRDAIPQRNDALLLDSKCFFPRKMMCIEFHFSSSSSSHHHGYLIWAMHPVCLVALQLTDDAQGVTGSEIGSSVRWAKSVHRTLGQREILSAQPTLESRVHSRLTTDETRWDHQVGGAVANEQSISPVVRLQPTALRLWSNILIKSMQTIDIWIDRFKCKMAEYINFHIRSYIWIEKSEKNISID